MGIWDWTLEAYDRPGAREACLALQDDHGQHVSYLLWAAWAGETLEELLVTGTAAARAWDAAALVPLRQVRRTLKSPAPPIADGPREALREAVKGCELFAERALMEALAELSGRAAGPVDALAVLESAVRAWGRPAPREAVAALATALS